MNYHHFRSSFVDAFFYYSYSARLASSPSFAVEISIVVVDGNVPTKMMMSNDWSRTNVLEDDAFPYHNCLFLSSASNPSYYEIDFVHPPHRADDYDDGGVVADANYRRRLANRLHYFFPLIGFWVCVTILDKY
jgi:hypothetical protein